MPQSPDVLEREAEVYCDMVLTGQKPVSLVPSSDPLVSEVARKKGLATIVFGTHGTYIFRSEGFLLYRTLLQLTQRLLEDEHKDEAQIAVYHWIRGHLFGYGEAEILAYIERCGP